ncbi:MAG: hypothetical protein HON82_02875 [Candidatus Marinimicrobia bacterium]|jgi:hypothetical protein|nr:hypothetical protein [Candidatus Neomarinimicrobiota bacterium]
MDTIFYGSGEVYVEPTQPLSHAEKTRRSLDARLNPKITYEYEISYDRFIKKLRSAKAVAIGIFPMDLGRVWIRFPLKGANEAIAKLGKELETAPNISND